MHSTQIHASPNRPIGWDIIKRRTISGVTTFLNQTLGAKKQENTSPGQPKTSNCDQSLSSQTKDKNKNKKQSQNNNSTQQRPSNPATDNNVGNSSMPRVVHCPELHDNANNYFQNIKGIRRNEDKLEYISCTMIQKNIQAYLIAETHLEGNLIKYLPKGQIMIHCMAPKNSWNK